MFIYVPDQETITPPSGTVDWGDIGGDIEDQTDLKAELDSVKKKMIVYALIFG
jgi:hypothetical protein